MAIDVTVLFTGALFACVGLSNSGEIKADNGWRPYRIVKILNLKLQPPLLNSGTIIKHCGVRFAKHDRVRFIKNASLSIDKHRGVCSVRLVCCSVRNVEHHDSIC